MKKIIDGVLYDTTTITKVNEDDYGAEVHTVYEDGDKYLIHYQVYDSNGTLTYEDLRDCTEDYKNNSDWLSRIMR